jgi:hypothetical protein
MSEANSESVLVFRVLAAFLDSGRIVNLSSHTVALIPAGALLFSAADSHPAQLCWSLCLLLWPLQCWLALRVAIDAGLFKVLAVDSETLNRFDEVLRDWQLRRKSLPRTAAERCRAALGLWRRQVLVGAVQIATLGLGLALNSI